jgi:hypothetical protein
MKIKHIIYSILAILFCVSANAQQYYKSYNIEDSTFSYQGKNDFKKLVLLEKEVVEYIYENDNLQQYELKHKVEIVNSNEEVENNNVKYIPYALNTEIVDARARVIKPDGKKLELDKSKILESFDEETETYYKYFALEGLAKGDIIEYFYVLKKKPYYYGTKKVIQEEYPILDYQFELLAPKNLIFEFNIINDTTTVKNITTDEEKNIWEIKLNNIPELIEEQDSPYKLLLKQFVFKLDRNISMNLKDISSYGKASQNVYNNFYNNIDKSDIKAIAKLAKQIKVKSDQNLDDKIYLIENFIKSNIHMVEYDSKELSKISSIIESKVASSFGITKILINMLKHFEINHQIVLTSDRTKMKFDKDFEAFNYLEKYLVYFPETKKFIAPDEFEYRYGLIPIACFDNYGLFVKEISIGDLNTGLGKIKFIEPLGYDKTHHNLIIYGKIKPDFSDVRLNIKQSSLGYYASPIQPYLNLISEDIKKNILDETMESFIPNSKIHATEVKNGSASSINIDPLILEFDITNTDLIDVAGDRFLFKIGSLIGPQVELYSESERKLPVYDNYKRTFDREIQIQIPDGYTIKNLHDLEMSEKFEKDGKLILIFESKYTLKDNLLKISIKEFYDQIYFSLDEYSDYRRVVNSAADFSKIVLVIQK